jgi:hypothetical protein
LVIVSAATGFAGLTRSANHAAFGVNSCNCKFGPPLSARSGLQDIELEGLSQEPCGATRMSALGQMQTFPNVRPMSALPPIADIGTQPPNVRFVPKAECDRRRGQKGERRAISGSRLRAGFLLSMCRVP